MWIKVLTVVVIVAGLLLMYCAPAVYVGGKGRFWRGVFWCWGLQVLVMALLSVPVPWLFAAIFADHEDFIYNSFPEANSIVAAAFTGWLWGMIASGIGWVLYRWRKKKEDKDGG